MSNYKLAKLLGCSQSSVKNWVSGATFPQGRAITQLCDVFGVSRETLLGQETKKDPTDMTDGEVKDELIEILEELKDRPEMRMLFKSARNATAEQIQAIANMIEGFKK